MKSLRDKRRAPRTSIETVYQRALEVFQEDKDRALNWYLTPLPVTGLSPYEMCKHGKAKSILKLLNSALVA